MPAAFRGGAAADAELRLGMHPLAMLSNLLSKEDSSRKELLWLLLS